MNKETILFTDLQDLFKNKSKYYETEIPGKTPIAAGACGILGKHNEKFRFYKHPGLPEGIFMKEIHLSDSYGGDFTLSSIEFVEGKEKTITVYEPI